VVIGGLVAGLALTGVGSDSAVEAASTKAGKKAKNVIVMISDGCGYNHVTATDYYMGKKQAYESFPVRLGMSTYEYEAFKAADKAGMAIPLTNWYGEPTYLLGYDPVMMWDQFNYSAYPFSTD